MAEQNRILVLFGNVPLLGNERANIETMRQLKERGADVLFLIRKEWTEDMLQPELVSQGLAFETVPYFGAARKNLSPLIWAQNIVRIIGASAELLWRARTFRATHVHCGSLAWVLNFMPALMVMRQPLVFRAGEMPPLHHVLWRLVFTYLRRRAARVVCDSYFMQQQMIALGVPASKCEVVYAPPPKRPRAGSVHEARPDGNDGVPVILFVGQISAEKGVLDLVEAAADLAKRHSFRMRLVGSLDMDKGFVGRLKNLISERGLEQRVELSGWVEDVGACYRAADIHVAPSLLSEGYGLSIVEAKANGLPSVIYASGGMAELVEHGVDGLIVRNRTPAGLVEMLGQYLDDPGMRSRHGSAALDSLTGRLRVQHFGAGWQAVYDETRLVGGVEKS